MRQLKQPQQGAVAVLELLMCGALDWPKQVCQSPTVLAGETPNIVSQRVLYNLHNAMKTPSRLGRVSAM